MHRTDSFQGFVELAPSFAPRPGITHVLFDFDGTLSLIREGWPDVMVPMFVEMLPLVPGETEADRRRLCFDDIMRLNGKQTIYQMIQLAERIKERGGQPQDPLWYKHEYLRRLEERIGARLDTLRAGTAKPEDLIVFGARALLESLRRRGLHLYLASGTDEVFVKREAELLDLARYLARTFTARSMTTRRFPKSSSLSASCVRTASQANVCSRSGMVTSRSRTPGKLADWPWPSPATRHTTAAGASSSGHASDCSGWERTW
jgi:phosphoglycolate phosphatase-like HAD superfamily hydrolase